MFYDATNFNQFLNFNNTSNVENMSGMFYDAINFNNNNQTLILNINNYSETIDFNTIFNDNSIFNKYLLQLK